MSPVNSKRSRCIFILAALVALAFILFSIDYTTKEPVNSRFDCIFGFSTGHVGTTTMSDYSSYNNGRVRGLGLMFEGKVFRTNKKIYVPRERYRKNFTIADEVDFVSKKFAPAVARLQKLFDTEVIMDLGHYNLFYYRGLVEYFTQKKYESVRPSNICKRILFVRIRRQRIETAFSLLYRSSGRTISDICSSFTVGFCPFHNENNVILQPPSEEKWRLLTPFQQCLWLIDETEARWRAFTAAYPNIETIDVYWSSRDPGSLQRVLDEVSDILGLPNVPETFEPAHKRVHAGKNGNKTDIYLYTEMDRMYRQIMQYDERGFHVFEEPNRRRNG